MNAEQYEAKRNELFNQLHANNKECNNFVKSLIKSGKPFKGKTDSFKLIADDIKSQISALDSAFAGGFESIEEFYKNAKFTN